MEHSLTRTVSLLTFVVLHFPDAESERLWGEYVGYETERLYTPKLIGPSTNNLDV